MPNLDGVANAIAKIRKDTFCVLGPHILFFRGSPSSWEEKSGAELPEHPIIGGRPKLQGVGQKLDELSLEFQQHTQGADLKNVFNLLYDSKEAFEVLPLTMGDGEYLGDFVITDLTFKRDATFANGTVMASTMRVSLKEWVATEALELRPRVRPPAIKGNGTATKTPPGPKVTPPVAP